MGWKAYYLDGRILEEGVDGRPVQDGEEGKLQMITQEDYGHRVAIDLVNGVILLEYESIGIQNGTIEAAGVNAVLYVCDETNIVGELVKVKKTRPNKEGWFKNKTSMFQWRPIWFTRHSNVSGDIKILGLQTTLVPPYGRRNVKKLISLFEDGRVGIH